MARTSPVYESECHTSVLLSTAIIQDQHTDDRNKVKRMGVKIVFGSQPGKEEALLQSTIRETFINADTPSCKDTESGTDTQARPPSNLPST